MRPVLAILMSAVTALSAQQIGQNTQGGANGVATFSASAQLVIETVVVTDKSGRPVEGLTANDFTVTENGVPQTIKFFDHQRFADAPSAPLTRSEHEDIHIYDRLGRTQISRGTPGNTRYKDRRLLGLYFDLTAMPPWDQVRALAAAEKFIRSQITAADLVAILRYAGGAVDVLQDFTADRDRLLSILQT